VQVLDLVYNSTTQSPAWRCLSGCDTYAPGGRSPRQNTSEPRDDGRCGPNFGNARCKHDYPWCNYHEHSGWCGNTHEHRDAQDDARFDWRATEPWPSTSLWSMESSYGNALALQGPILAVGAPGGAGFVDIRMAVGLEVRGVKPQALAGNSRYTKWSPQRILSESGSKGFGYRLAMEPGLLVVSAAGASTSSASVHLYALSETTGSTSKLCQYSKPPGSDFGASLAIQRGRGNRFTVLVGNPSESHVYAILVTPDEQNKCRMQTLIRQHMLTDFTGDGFGMAIAITHQFLFIGAPSVRRTDQLGAVISGLLHVLPLCTEGNYLLSNAYEGCTPCPNGQWSTGGQIGTCSRCIPEYSTPLQACNFTCVSNYFGQDCLACSQAMSKANVTKPTHSRWIDGRGTCSFECDLSYGRVDDECVKCDLAAEDYSGTWIPQTCSWTCLPAFFAQDEQAKQPDCVRCSVLKERQAASKPAHSEWLDGRPDCRFGPEIGYNCTNDSCEPCPALVQHAHWTNLNPRLGARCDFACDQGYFGHPEFHGRCEVCAVYLEEILPKHRRPTKPARSQWINNLTCDAASWACIDGTHLGSTGNYCCPDQIAHSIEDASVNPCKVRCLEGFWWDKDEASCRTCFPLPQHARWSTGNCTFVPLPGYKCDDGVCSRCPTASSLPVHAGYIDSDVACTYACNEGFFGHPQYRGICERCSVFMLDVVSPGDRIALPKHAFWEDGVTKCDRDSWTCGETYVKSVHARYCCPKPPYVNGQFWEAGKPCPVSCNPGFIWSDADERCVDCPARPAGAEWTYGCNFKCSSGLFGDDLGVCVTCRAYHELKNTRLPPRASWPEETTSCGDVSWVCDGGSRKFLEATKPGCCPTELPEGAMWNGPQDSCGFQCDARWKWDDDRMTCVGCPPSSYTTKPSSPKSTYFWGDTCSYKCTKAVAGSGENYFEYPAAPAALDECLSCKALAERTRWRKPDYALWPGECQPRSVSSSTVCAPDSPVCNADSWSCYSGHIDRRTFGLCCAPETVPAGYDSLTAQGRGSWIDGTCEWRCNAGFFPTVPQPEHRSNCMLCKDYLDLNKVPSCYSEGMLSQQQKLDLQCGTKDSSVTKPRQCVAQVAIALTVHGLSLAQFTSEVELVFRNGIVASWSLFCAPTSTCSGLIQADDVYVTSVVESNSGRRQSPLAQQKSLSLNMEIRNVLPHAVGDVREKVAAGAIFQVNKGLNLYGIPAVVDCVAKDAQLRCQTALSGGAAEWSCKGGKTFNAHTGKCCSKSIMEIPESEVSRYIWMSSGCDWTCRKGFLQMATSGRCLTCSEYNIAQKRFNPPNSVWKSDSSDCSEWVCYPGHVRSASGFSCISITKLQQACAALTRCAQCVQDGDCVWCNGQCKAGLLKQDSPSCPYTSDGLMGPCTCETDTCRSECTHSKCGVCVKDDYCGWCKETEKCLLGNFFRPLTAACPAAQWVFDSGNRCSSVDDWWIIGLVLAAASTLLVACFGGYIVTRLRRSTRRRQEQAAGRSPEQIQLREETQRFVATFPTFKYNGTKMPKAQRSAPSSPDGGEQAGEQSDANEDDDDLPMCSICLVSP
jgi:hypothetical protein